MDGTLVDTERYWMAAEEELVESFGGTLDPRGRARARRQRAVGVGAGVPGGGRRPRRRHDRRAPHRARAGAARRARRAVAAGRARAARGAPRGIRAHRARDHVGPLDGRRHRACDPVRGVRRDRHRRRGRQREAAPRALPRGRDALGVDVRDCVAIEDSPAGLTSAWSAGAVTVGVPNFLAARRGARPRAVGDPRRQVGVGCRGAPRRAGRRAHEREPRRAQRAVPRRATACSSPAPRAGCTPSPSSRASCSTRTRAPIAHDDLIGLPDGSVVANQVGIEYLALRPLLSDFVMSMPRGAAIVYPKDAAQILAQADVFPGATVVEAGVGSGALSLWLLRAIGPAGRLLSFERREEFADVARGNVATFHGHDPENWSITLGDLAEALPGQARRGIRRPRGARHARALGVHRRRLDRAEARRRAALLHRHGHPALPGRRGDPGHRQYTEPQSSRDHGARMARAGPRGAPRPPHDRPHRLPLTARRLAPGTVLPELKRRPSKTEFSDEDVEAWTPGALGERAVSAKALRKRVRVADAAAERSRALRADGAAPDDERPAKPCRLSVPLRDPSKNRGSVRSSLALIATAGLVAAALTGCSLRTGRLRGDPRAVVRRRRRDGRLRRAASRGVPVAARPEETQCTEVIAGEGERLQEGQQALIGLAVFNGATGEEIAVRGLRRRGADRRHRVGRDAARAQEGARVRAASARASPWSCRPRTPSARRATSRSRSHPTTASCS